ASQRMGSVLTILIGVTCAVGVLVSMLAMGSGARRQALGNVRDDRVVITSLGARGIQSSIPRDEADTIRNLPGLRIGSDGKPMVVLQYIVPIEGRRRVSGTRGFFGLIGITDSPLRDSQPEVRFSAGRMFRPGLHELTANNPCVHQFTGFSIG